MGDRKGSILLPKDRRTLNQVGEQIRLARLRRKLSTEMVSERAGISRPTLNSIEKGEGSVSIGHYFNVLKVLGLEQDFLHLAKDDQLGRKLQDANLTINKRAPKNK